MVVKEESYDMVTKEASWFFCEPASYKKLPVEIGHNNGSAIKTVGHRGNNGLRVEMSSNKIVAILFYVAAAYDFIFGITFFFAAPLLFKSFNVEPPNHWGYVHFPSLVLIIFGVMFYQIAQKPEQNRNLIPYGVMLKFSYAGVVFWHWFFGHNMPAIWKPFAVIDVLFLGGMLWAMNVLARQARSLGTY